MTTASPHTPALPPGVRLHQLPSHDDERGSFIEVFRRSWPTGVDPLQWNVVHSHAGVLRGVHVHHIHDDYLLLTRGSVTVGLHDLRTGSPAFGNGYTVDLSAIACAAIVIPVGVAHGFLFSEPSTHLYAVTAYWNADDELGCLWNDPGLKIDWRGEPSLISERDQALPSVDGLLRRLEPVQHMLWPPREY